MAETAAGTIRRILRTTLGVGDDRLRDDARLIADLGADLFDLTEIGICLIVAAVGEGDVDIDIDDATTVGDLVAAFEAKLGAAA